MNKPKREFVFKYDADTHAVECRVPTGQLDAGQISTALILLGSYVGSVCDLVRVAVNGFSPREAVHKSLFEGKED